MIYADKSVLQNLCFHNCNRQRKFRQRCYFSQLPLRAKFQTRDDFAKINEIYKQYFSEPYPARSCVEVARLPKDVLIEVEAIAEK